MSLIFIFSVSTADTMTTQLLCKSEVLLK